MAEKVVDIRSASLVEFQDFVFEHEVCNIESDCSWYHQFDLTIYYDAEHSARLFTEMFKNARSLPSKYGPLKLEQGCWAMFGSGFDGNLNDLIWESRIDPNAKEDLILSMYFVYRDLFAHDPLGEACVMWWDSLAYYINPMQRADPVNNVVHHRIQNAMFETLAKILRLEARHCQFAALHGLNHVLHPKTKSLIKNFVENHPDLTDREVEYANACANGKAI